MGGTWAVAAWCPTALAPFAESHRQAATNPKLDDPARAAWHEHVAGNTQDQISAKPGVLRQSAQRLVSLALANATAQALFKIP